LLISKNDERLSLSGSKQLTKNTEYKGSAFVSFEHDYAKEGDILKGKVKATYRHGGPIAESSFKLRLPGGNSIDLKTDAKGEAEFTYDTLADLSGSVLNFFPEFHTLRVFSKPEVVYLDPVDLIVSSTVNKNVVTVGESLTLTCSSKNFKGNAVESTLKIEIFSKESNERLNLIKGSTSIYTKLEEVDTFNLPTIGEQGEGTHDFSFDKPGLYYIKITGEDQYGNTVNRSLTVKVLGESSAEKLSIFRENTEVFDDEEVAVRVFSNLSKPTPVMISIETHRSIERKVVTLKKGDNTIKMDLNSRHSPGFNFSIVAIDNRELFTASRKIDVSMKLSIEANYVGVDEDSQAKAGSEVKVNQFNPFLKITHKNRVMLIIHHAVLY